MDIAQRPAVVDVPWKKGHVAGVRHHAGRAVDDK